VSLTPSGECVLKQAREILALANRLKRVAIEKTVRDGGTLSIGFITSASQFLLPEVLPALRSRHPEIKISARELLSVEQLAALQIGTLDAAVCRPPIRAKSLAVLAELDDPFCLAVPRGHALARPGSIILQAAADCAFISYKRDQARGFFDQTLNFCAAAGFNPAIRCEVSTTFGILNMVAAEVGVAIVPASCAPAAGPQVVLRRLIRPIRPGAIVLVGRKRPAPILTPLVSLVEAAFRRLRASIAGKVNQG
jgi:DNA-binding transcriptional LysR family regulator